MRRLSSKTESTIEYFGGQRRNTGVKQNESFVKFSTAMNALLHFIANVIVPRLLLNY